MTERLHFHFYALEKEMPTDSCVLAWRIPGTGSLVGCHLGGRTESDTTEATWQQQQQQQSGGISNASLHILRRGKMADNKQEISLMTKIASLKIDILK